MCKIFIVAGVKPTTVDKVWKFAETIAKPMSRVNTDGLGYGAITASGHIFGERWLTNDHAFQTEEQVKGIDDNYAAAVATTTADYQYSSYGVVDKASMVALTMHTRMATTPRGLMNVHPFVLDDVSLIHNGVIRNHSEFKLQSTCDSEAILQAYVQKKVWEAPDNFNDAAAMLQGYYACGVLVNTEQGPFLDMFKANAASLYVGYVKELETHVVCTSDDDIKNTCKELGYSVGTLRSILPGKFIRVNAITGKSISISDFKESKTEYVYSGSYGHNGYNGPHNDYFNRNNNNRNFLNSQTSQTGNQSSGKVSAITSNLPTVLKREEIVPWGKSKKSLTSDIPKDVLEYLKSGRMDIKRMSDLEIQQEVMDLAHINGRY